MKLERWRYAIPLRLRSLFLRDEVEQELDEELQYHLDQKTQQYANAGMSAEEARRCALRDIDGLELRKEQCRDARRINRIEDLIQDLRFSARTLRKSPGFTSAAVLTLALGIGANAAIFSVVNAVLLRGLPYPDANRILTVSQNQSLPDLEDIQKEARSFSAVGGFTKQALSFTGQGDPVEITGSLCNADLFSSLGVQPVLGRSFTAEEDRCGGPALIILSNGFWSRYFGSDPTVIGKSIRLSGNSYTVIGVMPRDFWLPGKPVDVLGSLRVIYPLAAKFRGVHFLQTYFRLRSGVSIDQAAAEMKNVDDWLERHYPESDRDFHRQLIPLRKAVVGDVRMELMVMFAAVGVVLLVACVNFAGLQLARSATRRREIAIRATLGAPAGRLIRQIVTESVLLSLLGRCRGACPRVTRDSPPDVFEASGRSAHRKYFAGRFGSALHLRGFSFCRCAVRTDSCFQRNFLRQKRATQGRYPRFGRRRIRIPPAQTAGRFGNRLGADSHDQRRPLAAQLLASASRGPRSRP